MSKPVEAATRIPALLARRGAYVGSRAVPALQQADRPVKVFDNVSIGFRWAVPDSVSFAKARVGEQVLLARLLPKKVANQLPVHFQ